MKEGIDHMYNVINIAIIIHSLKICLVVHLNLHLLNYVLEYLKQIKECKYQCHFLCEIATLIRLQVGVAHIIVSLIKKFLLNK